jgi:hypothetical protein
VSDELTLKVKADAQANDRKRNGELYLFVGLVNPCASNQKYNWSIQ